MPHHSSKAFERLLLLNAGINEDQSHLGPREEKKVTVEYAHEKEREGASTEIGGGTFDGVADDEGTGIGTVVGNVDETA